MFGDSISSIESGGNYNLLGPVTKSGDRAYGKYQVMGSNIPEWTKAALGKELTPAEFRADPRAQDAVFQHRFGQYVDKYGPEGAARAWFAGEGGMNDPNRKDQFGTSVASYGQRFMAGLQPPPQAQSPAPSSVQAPVSPPLGAPETPPTTVAQTNASPMGEDIRARLANILTTPSPPDITGSAATSASTRTIKILY